MLEQNIRVMGLDTALRNTGVSLAETCPSVASLSYHGRLSCSGSIPGRSNPDGKSMKYNDLPEPERPVAMAKKIGSAIKRYKPDLIVMEGYAYNSPKRTYLPALAEVVGIVKNQIVTEGHRLIVVSPSALKKFGTNKGNAKKDDMIKAANKIVGKNPITTSDEADAVLLSAFGVCFLGGVWRDRSGKRRLWSAWQKETVGKFELPGFGNVFTVQGIIARAEAREARDE